MVNRSDGSDDDEDESVSGESSLEELVKSISNDDEPQSESGESSLKDLAESLEQRNNDDHSTTDLDQFSFDWVGDQHDQDESGDEARSKQERSRTPATSTLDDIDPDSDVLFLGSLTGDTVDQYCGELLAPLGGSVDNVLLVTVTQSADERLSRFREHARGSPENTSVISIGDQTRSASSSSSGSMGGSKPTSPITTVTDPSDLSRLGITINRRLSEWKSDQTRVCFHSLTALLQYVDQQQLFRFLHVLQGKSESLNTGIHYHMDPAAHDDQTVRLFTALFDTVVRVADDGSLDIEQ